LNPEAGFPGQLQVAGSRAELVSSEIATVVANLDLALAGPLARTPRIGGRVDLVSMDVSIPDRLPATLRPLPGTRHLAPPPQVRARLVKAERAAVRQSRRGPAPFDASFDLLLSAPNRIFVRGRGVDAELGGNLRLTGTSRQPVAVGAFELRRGRLSVAGQRLDFSRGRLAFTGDLAPALDFVAETRAGDVKAQVAITGPASQPVFALTSEPALPQDEVLSRLLFAKASGNLSAFQALQLAQGRGPVLRLGQRTRHVRASPPKARGRQPGHRHGREWRAGGGRLALHRGSAERRRAGRGEAGGLGCDGHH
jgi:translocation and assembly module TamB